MLGVPLMERVSCTQKGSLSIMETGTPPPGGNLILLGGYANVFHRDYRDGFDFNGGMKNSSVAEKQRGQECSVRFGPNPPLC